MIGSEISLTSKLFYFMVYPRIFIGPQLDVTPFSARRKLFGRLRGP